MKKKVPIPASADQVVAFGVHDTNLRLIERLLPVKMTPGESFVVIEGNDAAVRSAANVLHNLFILSRGNSAISHNEIRILLEESEKISDFSLDNIAADGLLVSQNGKRIKPRNTRQLDYIRQMMDHDLVFCVGPAGTGKTFLAIAAALNALITGRCSRIILTRPVVEAGENLGFLPGTLEEKIDPYLRPLFDALHFMLSAEEAKLYFSTQTIELAPLAYMRGRTLSHAFVILDEAQNTSSTQMKMFLTRLGESSKMVVTGDISQIDLPRHTQSGLTEAFKIFRKVSEIGFTEFHKDDVIRHGLVKKIIAIYEKNAAISLSEGKHNHEDI